ncbi:metallophosphoesterase [Desulfofalx alkaliphila]|uniref:metallophosphoesterase n=1 Tax=Desulfofalx alkaliphila TaxID=105483 RepID=UPI0004E1C234|nr:metallophosphoesterase [Desulfofalx alkaliphila]
MNNTLLTNLIIVGVFIVYGVINYFIGRTCWEYLFSYIPHLNEKVFWLLFWFVAWSYILLKLLNRYLPHGINSLLSWVGGFWLSILFYLSLLLLGILLIKLLNSYFNFLPPALQNPHGVTVGLLIVLGLLLACGLWNARNIERVPYDVVINKEAGNFEELKIVLVADLHLDHINNKRRLEKIVAKINESEPDLVLLAGDLVDTDLNYFKEQQMDKTLQKIQSKYGVYGVPGNHEYYNSADINDLMSAIEGGNVKMLRDEYVKVQDSFYIVGRDDLTVGQMHGAGRKNLSSLMKDFDKKLPIILIDHQPLFLKESQENGVDLHLSGHTHGGQLFPNHLITQRMFEIDRGHLIKDKLHVIVTSGVNTWGPVIRLGTKAEIINIKVTFNKQ